MYSIGFLMGCWSLMQLTVLPGLWMFVLGCVFCFGLGVLLRDREFGVWGRWKVSCKGVMVFLGCCFLGLFWQGWHCNGLLGKELGLDEEGNKRVVVGRISDIPVCDTNHCTFNFVVNSDRRKFRLSWYGLERPLHVGEAWSLVVRLKRVHGTMNPGGFDLEAWSWQQHISGKGYVVNGGNNQFLGMSSGYSFVRWRESVLHQCKNILQDNPLGGIITALNLGWTQDIPYFQKVIAQRTGTAHLLAISGLHVGMVAGWVFWVVSGLWSKVPRVTEFIPGPMMGALCAIFFALIYSEMAGFACSTQRACVMSAFLFLPKFAHRHISVKTALFRALWIVLLWDPCVVLSSGFWLSFGAVFVLVYAYQFTRMRINDTQLRSKTSLISTDSMIAIKEILRIKIKQFYALLQTQWICLIGLLPLSCWYFHQVSLVSVISNLIAIPIIGALVLPLILLGTVFLSSNVYLAKLFFIGASKIVAILGILLQWLSQKQWSVWNFSFSSTWEIVVVFVGCGLLVFTRENWRWLGLLGLVPLSLPNIFPLQQGQFKLSVLDVGQGLASVISTQQHTLIYDTGAKLSEQLDCGQQIVLPYLINDKVRSIDTLVLSHGDNDHAGGASAIVKAFPVKKIYTSATEKIAQQMKHQDKHVSIMECKKGMQWKWDNVKFEFLHPDSNPAVKDNDKSCVLKVSSNYGSVLLTGDIEKPAEHLLTLDYADQLKSTILIVPHHGSKSSSTARFIEAVNPQVAILSFGYRNRYHHPSWEVVRRYLKKGTVLYNTVNSGALSYIVGQSTPWQQFRSRHQEFWRTEKM